jgi:hypothetical protein
MCFDIILISQIFDNNNKMNRFELNTYFSQYKSAVGRVTRLGEFSLFGLRLLWAVFEK